MKLYALHDKKAKSLSSFHVERSDVVASRSFAEACVQKDSVFAKYPTDFELVSLCDVSQEYDFSPQDSILVGEYAFKVVITAEQVLAAQPQIPKEQLSLLPSAEG